MPPLYKFDDYDECFGKYETSTYCVVNTYIKPDDTSEIYGFIKVNICSKVLKNQPAPEIRCVRPGVEPHPPQPVF